MKVLGIHADVTQLGGHTRLFLMMMDVFKSLGCNINIVSRTEKESVAVVDSLPFMDPRGDIKPLRIPTTVKSTMKLSHHKIEDVRKYQPLRYVKPGDISAHDIPVIYWGDRFLTPWAPKVIKMINKSDYVFGDTEMYVRMESNLPIANKHIQFVHFPTENLFPVFNKEPKHIWANSRFTQSWIRIRWGFNNPNYIKLEKDFAVVKIPKQVFNAEVVNPPLYLDDYMNDFGFKDRQFDVVMFARLGEDKFTVAGFLDEHFNLLSMGAQSPIQEIQQAPGDAKTVNLNLPATKKTAFKPRGQLKKNLSFNQVKQFLGHSKVYVHGKGFGKMESGGVSQPEHFGITICEAMASGCPVVVPRIGGCWTDISQYGKYTLAYSSLEELKVNVETLVKDRKEWEKWHDLALEGVQRFDVENTKERVKEILFN